MCKYVEKPILTRARNGDEEAFETVARSYYMMIYKVAYKWVGRTEPAEDITQDVCLKLARKIHQFEHKSSFDTWLYRMVVNQAKDYFKATSRKKAKHEAYSVDAPKKKGAEQEEQLKVAELYKAIYKLPEQMRDTVMLVAAEGLSHQQAAEVLGCKEGTISYRMHEARNKLTHILGEVL